MDLTSGTGSRGKWLALIAAILGWMFDGFEMGMFPLVARPAMLELLGPDAFKASFGTWSNGITAGFLVGAACGGVLFGWLGDRIGRVRAMTISVLVYSLFSGLACFAQAPWHIAATRMVAALGMGGEWALGVALVMEMWGSTSRPLMAGLIGAAANVGFLLVAVIGLSLNAFVGGIGDALRTVLPTTLVEALQRNEGWRLLALIGALPAVLTFLIRLFVPESEKWKHAAANGPKNRVADIFVPGLRRRTLLGLMLAGIALLGTWASTQNLPNWAGKLTESVVKERQAAVTLASADASAAPGPAAAALLDAKAAALADAKATAKTAKPYTQIWSAFGACVGTIVAALLAQLFSRRLVYFGLALASLVVTGWFFRSGLPYGGTFLAGVFFTGLVTASFYGWLPLYLPELFPTRVRATAQGFAFNGGRIVAAAGTFASGPLLDKQFAGDYGAMCAWISLIYLVGLVGIWFCPETKGQPLPE